MPWCLIIEEQGRPNFTDPEDCTAHLWLRSLRTFGTSINQWQCSAPRQQWARALSYRVTSPPPPSPILVFQGWADGSLVFSVTVWWRNNRMRDEEWNEIRTRSLHPQWLTHLWYVLREQFTADAANHDGPLNITGSIAPAINVRTQLWVNNLAPQTGWLPSCSTGWRSDRSEYTAAVHRYKPTD
jgi:hypothetical protein